VKATKVNAGLAESNGRLLLGIWRDSLHVACGLTACTPGSAPGPTLGNEYGKTLPLLFKVSSDVTGSDPNTSSAAAAATGQKSDSAAHLLASIRDLVATKLHCDAQLRREAAENERLVREWTTAAKVVDRICFVTHCVVLIAGSAIFLTLLF